MPDEPDPNDLGPNDPDPDEIDLGQLVSDAVEEKLKALNLSPKGTPGSPAPEGSGSAPGSDRSSSSPPDGDDLDSRVAAAVAKILDDRDHQADHEKLRGGPGPASPPSPSAPSSPTPPRKRGGIASVFFGKKADA